MVLPLFLVIFRWVLFEHWALDFISCGSEEIVCLYAPSLHTYLFWIISAEHSVFPLFLVSSH